MTPADLLPIIRRDYLDEDPVVIGDPEKVARWPREFILRAIGEAQRQACLRQDLRHIFDDTTPELCEIDIAAGTTGYVMDYRVLRVKAARMDGATSDLRHVMREDLDRMMRNWQASTGIPRMFWVDQRRLNLWPSPSASGTLRLSVWRLPLLPDPNWNDDLEWPGEQEKLAHWVAYRAFLRPNPDTVQVELAKTHLSLFEQAFGAAVSERVRAELLTAPSDINIRPGASLRRGECLHGW